MTLRQKKINTLEKQEVFKTKAEYSADKAITSGRDRNKSTEGKIAKVLSKKTVLENKPASMKDAEVKIQMSQKELQSEKLNEQVAIKKSVEAD